MRDERNEEIEQFRTLVSKQMWHSSEEIDRSM
jgi:hypothetical protein